MNMRSWSSVLIHSRASIQTCFLWSLASTGVFEECQRQRGHVWMWIIRRAEGGHFLGVEQAFLPVATPTCAVACGLVFQLRAGKVVTSEVPPDRCHNLFSYQLGDQAASPLSNRQSSTGRLFRGVQCGVVVDCAVRTKWNGRVGNIATSIPRCPRDTVGMTPQV